MTNGDYIRSLSDEELAKFLCKLVDKCDERYCPMYDECLEHTGDRGKIEWIRSEMIH